MPQEPIRPTPTPASRESVRRDLGAGFRRAIGLTALGTVLPGTGLTQTRSRRLGWALFVIFLAIVATTAYFVLTRGTMVAALDLVSRPDLVQQLGIGFAVCGLVWCASIVLTAVLTKPSLLDRSRTRVLVAFTTVMVLLVAGLSYKVAEYATITKDTVAQVFGPEAPTPGDGAKVVQGEDPWRDTPRVNVLLLGSDAGVGREGTRTDSMVVASIDTKTGKTVLISLPRNLENAPIPQDSPLRELYPSGTYGEPTCFRAQKDPADQCMLNAIWTEVDQYVLDHPNAYNGEAAPGRGEVSKVIGEILGLKIDHTVVVDLLGFQQLVDAMGGVDVNVKLGGQNADQPLPYGKKFSNGTYSTYFTKPGMQHLTGYEALWYARTRAADDDFFRQARQRCVLRAIVEQVNPASMLTKYAEVAKIAKDNIYTDIPAASLPAFVELVQRVQNAKISSVALSPSKGIYPGHPDYQLIRKLVKAAINPPAPTQTPSTASATKTPTSTKTTTKTPSTTSTSAGPADECA